MVNEDGSFFYGKPLKKGAQERVVLRVVKPILAVPGIHHREPLPSTLKP